MKNLYFPSINVTEDNWLKYALLYKEELYTIKPTRYTYDRNYDINSKLGIDFLKPYDPEAYLKAEDCEHNTVEKIILNSMTIINSRKKDFKLFNKKRNSDSENNLDSALRESEKNSLLFQGKYTPEIEEMVLEYGYGLKENDNLRVSNRFAIIYMGLLAERISYLDSSIIITGKPQNIAQYVTNAKIMNQGPLPLKKLNNTSHTDMYKEQILSHFIPSNIKELSLEKIVSIRNNDYLSLIKEFNSLVEKLYARDFRFENASDILKEIFSVSEYIEGIIRSNFGKNIIKIGLSAFLADQGLSFPMSEGLSMGIDHFSDSVKQKHDLITLKESNSTMKFFTTLNSL